ncbi:MAG TPA: hypothetical protein PLC98_22385 [Anaerolineales bacterium]|nr:hypothetical protein [Anaerolineales bacterium]
MYIDTTPDVFATLLGQVLGTDPSIIDAGYEYRIKMDAKSIQLTLTHDELKVAISRLADLEEGEGIAIAGKRNIETLVSEANVAQRLLAPPSLRELENETRDNDNGVAYRLGLPSDEYLLYLLHKLHKADLMQTVFRSYGLMRARRWVDRFEGAGVLELAKYHMPRLTSLRVETEDDCGLQELSLYTNAYLFQVCYNLDTSLVVRRSIEELGRSNRIGRMRRGRLQELDSPKRLYVPDLVYYYQMAVASDSPALQYLSYYHVAEYFFEAIFHDDLIERVTRRMTMPDFSYKRKKDIKALVQEISKSLKFIGDNTAFNEQEALRLTLLKHVDFETLRGNLRAYDPDILDYYRTSKVLFSGGDVVDLSDSDSVRLAGAIAARIYRTRNSIVHSKEGERSRYVPFRHDTLLVREIPLIRFASELIIIASSQVMS